jgi:hypothetical protein
MTVREIFSTPYDRPPDCPFMLIAYLDESGHEGKDAVVVAGFLGNENQWTLCEGLWREGLGKRKSLHMKSLRWKKDRVRQLLERLGPIPHKCGLRALVGGVRISDYHDLVAGTKAEKLTKGYQFCVMTVMDALAKNLPNDETVKLIFETQDQYEVQARNIFENNKHHVTTFGEAKFSSIDFIPKDSTSLTQPADYLAFAILQDYRDPKSTRARWCAPIRQITQPAWGMVPDQEGLRAVIKTSLDKHPLFAEPKNK